MNHIPINCAGCHNFEVFANDFPRNNGLYPVNKDFGIYIHTRKIEDIGKFKAPSLKNVALRGRFMHDGSLSSLDEVIEHYNTGIQLNETLDPHLHSNHPKTPLKKNLTASQKQALKAFLHTLTDNELIADPKFSNPFKD